MIRRRCSAAGGFFAGWLLLLDFAVLLLVGLAGVVSPALDSAYG